MTGPLHFHWRLEGEPHPPLEMAVLVAIAARAAIVKEAFARGLGGLPPALHGGPDSEHRHMHLLPRERTPGDGISCLLLHAAATLLEAEMQALLPVLAAPKSIWISREWARGRPQGPWRLLPSPKNSHGGLAGPARVWRTLTPYVPTKPPQAGRTVERMLRTECLARGLPEPDQVRLLDDPAAVDLVGPGRDFRVARAAPTHAALTFPADVHGPLALGAGCHWGLGVYVPQQM